MSKYIDIYLKVCGDYHNRFVKQDFKMTFLVLFVIPEIFWRDYIRE